MYVGKDYSKAAKTVNYVVLVNSCRKFKFIAVRYFIHVEEMGNVFFVGNELQLTGNSSILPQLHSTQLRRIAGEQWVISFCLLSCSILFLCDVNFNSGRGGGGGGVEFTFIVIFVYMHVIGRNYCLNVATVISCNHNNVDVSNCIIFNDFRLGFQKLVLVKNLYKTWWKNKENAQIAIFQGLIYEEPILLPPNPHPPPSQPPPNRSGKFYYRHTTHPALMHDWSLSLNVYLVLF